MNRLLDLEGCIEQFHKYDGKKKNWVWNYSNLSVLKLGTNLWKVNILLHLKTENSCVKKTVNRGIIVSCICVAPHNTSSGKPIKNFQATDMHKPQARDQIRNFSFYQRKKHNWHKPQTNSNVRFLILRELNFANMNCAKICMAWTSTVPNIDAKQKLHFGMYPFLCRSPGSQTSRVLMSNNWTSFPIYFWPYKNPT